ncbi:MAG: proton-conducting membrane transporter [Lachnospiraceae bacterium]|nr:proton-conducting membrane transporter [Lachnospiraceae bacterium]
MPNYMLLVVIVLPMITGILMSVIPWKSRRASLIFLETLVILNSILMWCILLNRPAEAFTFAKFTGSLTLTLKLDGMGMVFAGIVATLWPLATLYAFEYMTKEEHERTFFMFYILTYGVTVGISLAGNLLTMYFFYELLTIVTVPLVMHTLTREAIVASRKYLYFSIGGAAFGFLGLIFMNIYGKLDFVLGGTLDLAKIGDRTNILLLIYVLAFMGFGVKAAIWPLSSWLPQAGVAPTPVTALLHAVAVVKAGAFAILRFTYYCFGTDFVRGTWAQYLLMGITMFTIVYGCSRAVKETHIKRRLAYSTVSNLSYILFGCCIMTPLGMVGALSHMIFHAVMKICSFFCAGSIMHQTEKHYVHELDGLGRKMPWVFGIFTVSSFALMGVPGLAGFASKWNLATAAFESGNPVAIGGVGCLLISALLTAIYMLTIVIRGFFVAPSKEDEGKNYKDPNWMMLVPLMIFVILMIFFGMKSQLVTDFLTKVAGGFFDTVASVGEVM